MDKSNLKPIMLFQLGNLQVYHFQSPEEIARQDAPKQVFWQDVASRHTYGPFDTIHHAMNHYTWLIAMQKTDARGSVGNVVYIDFIKKKRVVIGGDPI